MKTNCTFCGVSVKHCRAKGYLSGQSLKDFAIDALIVEIRRYRCSGQGGCGQKFCRVYTFDSSTNQWVFHSIVEDDAMWNLAEKSKLGIIPFQTTCSEYTQMIKRDPAQVHRALLARRLA